MSNNQLDVLKNYVDNIESHLQHALAVASNLQQHVMETESDTDLFRKLSMYLTPNLTHWLTGPQPGNIKDLRELLARRAAQQGTIMQTQSHQGDGHDVLTKPSS